MTLSRSLSETSAERLPADARVRHFDELGDRAQTLVASGVEELPADHDDLAVGDVVVYTDWVRVGAE